MRPWASIAILLVLCAALGIAVYIEWPGNPAAPRLPRPERRVTQSAVLPAQPPPPAPAAADAAARTVALPEHPPAGAIPGEVVVNVGSGEAVDAFVEAARRAGLHVLGSSRTLGMVRLAARPGQMGRVTALLPDGATLDYNYRMSSPRPPSLPNGLGTPFDAGPADSVGIASAATAGRGARVAIIDSGVTPHRVLSGANISQIDLLGTGTYAEHGTAIASIIVGNAADLHGIAPSTTLLSVRALGSNGEGDSFTVAQGIVQAVDWGAQVISISAGTYGDSPALRAAVDYAIKAGAVVVSSAGNDATNIPLYPAAYKDVLGVAAVDGLASPAPFSNTGANADIAAPGVGVHVADKGDTIASMSGTSVSPAIVTGVLARYLSDHPGSTPAQAEAALVANVIDGYTPGPDPYLGDGIISPERLDRAGSANVQDLAVNDFYLSNIADGSATLNVLMQNRGTATSTPSTLTLSAGGRTYTFTLAALAPGSVGTAQATIPTAALTTTDGLQVDAQLATPPTDADPANNTRRRILHLTPQP